MTALVVSITCILIVAIICGTVLAVECMDLYREGCNIYIIREIKNRLEKIEKTLED